MKKISNRQRRNAATQRQTAERRAARKRQIHQDLKVLDVYPSADYSFGDEVLFVSEHQGIPVETTWDPCEVRACACAPSDASTTLDRHRQVISAYCLDCCCGSSSEVALCATKLCTLWPYRLGLEAAPVLKPKPESLAIHLQATGAQGEIKAIQRKCLDCSGGDHAGVSSCTVAKCGLHRFRHDHHVTSAHCGLAWSV
jgi:hypothetical protein